MTTQDRTLFARIELIAVGTQMVESLRSFVQRLAASHQMKPIAVLLDLVAAGLMKTSITAPEEINKHWAVHGVSSLGADLVGALEEACDTKLHGSTCSTLAGLVGIQHLTRSGPVRYCPVCASQSQRYGPLLFEVACVEACPVHGALLRNSNDCGAQQGMRLPAQNRPSEPGVCGSCGSIGHGCRSAVGSASPQQIWVAREVGALLAKMSASPSTWTSASLVQGLVELVGARFESSVVRAALRSGLSRGSVCTWIRGRGRPTLSMLVQLCQRADADVVALFDGRYLRSTSSIPNAASEQVRLELAKRKYRRSKISDEDLRALLLTSAAVAQPPSVAALAARLDMDASSITQRCPEAAKELVEAGAKTSAAFNAELFRAAVTRYSQAANSLSKNNLPINVKTVQEKAGLVAFGRNHSRRRALAIALSQIANSRESTCQS